MRLAIAKSARASSSVGVIGFSTSTLMPASSRSRDGEMLAGGDGDAGHVHAADEGPVVGEDPRVVLRRHGGGAREIRVHHADQLDVRQLRVHEHVVLAHVARADDTRAHLRSIRHQPVISSGSSMEPSAPFTIP